MDCKQHHHHHHHCDHQLLRSQTCLLRLVKVNISKKMSCNFHRMVSQGITSPELSRPHRPIKHSTTPLCTSVYSCVLRGIFPQISWLAWAVWLWGYGFVCRISSHNPLQNLPPFESTWQTPRTISCQDTQPTIKRSTHCHSYHLRKE